MKLHRELYRWNVGAEIYTGTNIGAENFTSKILGSEISIGVNLGAGADPDKFVSRGPRIVESYMHPYLRRAEGAALRAPKARSLVGGVWGGAPPENLEILDLKWCNLVHFGDKI